ncbi:MAG: XdhC family protein [Acidobacteriota bacterium]|nr:XdhC family protein [Acidobacteriota bacterium]
MSEWSALARRLGRGGPLALATVVATEGSAYRRPGAWMIVSEGGVREGLLSGGCLEADVVERARRALASGRPELVTYDTRDPDDVVWGLGMGCQGVVRIWIEALSEWRLESAARFFSDVAGVSEAATIVTLCGAEAGDASGPDPRRPESGRLLVGPDGVLSATGAAAGEMEEIVGRARERLADGSAPGIESVGGVRAAFARVSPRIRLLLCGAGEDAVPLARLAGDLDWSVVVADHRAAWALPNRFPGARVELVPAGSDLAPLLPAPHRRTAAVVMTHNIERDVQWAAALLPLELGYLGLLGPKRRGEQILHAARTLAAGESRALRVVTPIGLDIASETPKEIAVAIVAEISAALSGGSGGPLSARETPIHAASSAREAPSQTSDEARVSRESRNRG